MYRKVASSRPVYYSILELLGQSLKYISIKFPLHKPSENQKMCYCSRLYGIRFFDLVWHRFGIFPSKMSLYSVSLFVFLILLLFVTVLFWFHLIFFLIPFWPLYDCMYFSRVFLQCQIWIVNYYIRKFVRKSQ